MPRVAIIGAGSVEFTRNVVADLCSFPELAGQVTIALHDINAERLAYAERAAASIVRRTGAGHRVEASAERRPAEEGAPSTTAMSRLPLRVAVATRLKPEAQMKPVFMPSAPGKRPSSGL